MAHMQLQVNGQSRDLDVDPDTPLLLVLRNHLGLTGAKLGCGLEQCGACAVLVDGEATLTCTAPAADFAGRAITTVEGLCDGQGPGAVQQAFIDCGAAQCGYCTAGLVVAVTALARRDPHADEAALRAALQPHLCRCGSHPRVLRAARRALEASR